MTSLERTYYPSVDGLRAIAVLSVVLFHVDLTVLPGGFIGVDIFFVISGYLITKNITSDLHAQKFAVGTFFYRRFRRLFPALLVTIFLTFVCGAALLSPAHFAEMSGSAVSALFSVSNFYFWFDADYFGTEASLKPLLHFWSLSVEEQFYLFWPFLLLFATKILHHDRLWLLFVVLALVSTAAAEYVLTVDPAAAFYLMPFRIVEFAIGALCVSKARFWKSDFANNLATIVGLVGIAVALLTYSESTRFPGISALLPCLATALIILSKDSRVATKLLGGTWPVRIGLISYSMYLVHWPVVVYWKYITASPLTAIDQAIIVILCFVLAQGLYKLVEQPLRLQKAEEPFKKRNVVLAALGVLAVAITVPGVHAYSKGGWYWRVNPSSAQHQVYGQCRDKMTTPNETKLCTVGSESDDAHKMLLVGDSHTSNFRAALDYVGQELGIKVSIEQTPGCPHLVGAYKLRLEGRRESRIDCEKLVTDWEQRVARGQYEYVGFASRWSIMLEPTEYGALTLNTQYLASRENPQAGLVQSRATFSDSLAKTVELIERSGSKTILFSQVPPLGKNIQDCDQVPNMIISRDSYPKRCAPGISRAAMIDRVLFTNQAIEEISSPNVLHVIPSDYFCDESHCVSFEQGSALYQDTNHLSYAGSMWMAEDLLSLFKDFVQKPATGSAQ